jgi:hypothetical protein
MRGHAVVGGAVLPRISVQNVIRIALTVSLGLPILARAVEAADAPDSRIYTLTERLDMAMVKRHDNFGYTDEEIAKYFDYPQVFEYDETGMAPGEIEPPPAPGVHPRVLFQERDLPALRAKLAGGSKAAKIEMDNIRSMLRDDLTGPMAKYGALYAAAIRGNGSPEMLDVQVACPIIYESFRCLIDNDEAGGKNVAAALTTLAKLDDAELNKAFAEEDRKAAKNAGKPQPNTSVAAVIKPPMRDYQETKGLTQHGLLGLAYDFAYGWMTGAQRDVIRGVIAKASGNMTILCADGLPAFPANVSNWIPMHMRLIFLVCAIEGEKGYDAGTYNRCVAGYKRYLSVGLFPAGDMYESMGKNFICTENLIPIANRGNDLPALKNLRAQVDNYYLHAMDPWGGHFTFYDSLGGRGNTTPMFDVMVMKHIFPNDPATDFVYRNTVGEDYASLKGQIHFGHPFHLADSLIQAIFAEDYVPKSWEQAHDDATAGKSLTFFSNATGNLITSSSWDTNALQLHFLTRSVSGGHQYADRTHFSLHALGRYWAIYKPLRQVEEHYSPRNRSVVLIDGQGPDMTMGACVAMEDDPQATFIAADAKNAWEWGSGGNNRFPKGGVRVTATPNDFRLEKSDLPWMNLPFSDLPYWQTSMKGAENWIPRSPIQRAFRTAGLIRGAHPYVLIVDDIQKDAAPHQYQWGMILEDDLVQNSVVRDHSGGAFRDDVIIGEKTPTSAGARFLLVRTLNAEGGDGSEAPAIETFDLPNPPQRPIEMHRLNINSKCVAPDFKMLLFPYRGGQEQPITKWNADRTVLTIDWSDQHDTVSFVKGPDGRTRINVTRDAKEIVAVR